MGYEAFIDVPKLNVRPERAPAHDERVRLLLFLALMLLVGAAVRFSGIGSRALWLDEGYSAWFSELGWRELWLDTPKYETHPPVYYSLLKIWRSVVGDDSAALRCLSALAGLLAVPVIAGAARDLARLGQASRPLLMIGIAMGLMVLSPRLLIVAQDARPYALLLLAYALSIAAWLRLTVSFKGADRPEGRLIDWVALGIGTALTLWLHALGLIHAGALLGALLCTALPSADRKRWVRAGVTVALVALSYAPCFLMILGRRNDWTNGWVGWDPLSFPGALLDLYGFHHQSEIWTPIGARILFPALIGLGLRALWRRGDRPLATALGLLILLPPLAAALVSQIGQPIFVPRTLAAVLAPAYLVAAFGLCQLNLRSAALVGGVGAIILSVNLAQMLGRPSLEPWDEVAATIESGMQPGDMVWVYPNDTALPLGRALHRPVPIIPVPAPFPALQAEGRRPAGSPAVVAVDRPAARSFGLRHEPAPGAAIWVVIRNPGFFDPGGEVAKGLAQGRRRGAARHWRDIDLQKLYSR